MFRRMLPFACVPLGAAAGYYYLVRVLRPQRPSNACPLRQVHDWQCASYQFLVSKPSFVLAGALIGTWIAYALVGLDAVPRPRSVTRREALVVVPPLLGVTAWIIALRPGSIWFLWASLGWDGVLLFLLAAVLVRLAIGVASIVGPRGGLILAFGMPVICSGLGYVFLSIFRPPLSDIHARLDRAIRASTTRSSLNAVRG